MTYISSFQVDTFFAVGSPLGVFLALRNIRIGIGNTSKFLYLIRGKPYNHYDLHEGYIFF